MALPSLDQSTKANWIQANHGIEILGSSQSETTNEKAESPERHYDDDSDSQSTTDEARDESSSDFGGDIPPRRQPVRENKSQRVLRSQTVKREPNESDNTRQPTTGRRLTLRPAKRSHDHNQEAEYTRVVKRSRNTIANTEIERFGNDAHELVEKYTSKTRDLEIPRSEIRKLQTQVQALQWKLERDSAEYDRNEASQNQEIMRLRNECKRWRGRLASVLEAAKQESDKYIKVFDSEITEKWKALSFNIKGLVSHYLTAEPSYQSHVLYWLLMQIKAPSSFTNDIVDLRAEILRRSIWDFIIRAVFLGRSTIWYGEVGRSLTQLVVEYSKFFFFFFLSLLAPVT